MGVVGLDLFNQIGPSPQTSPIVQNHITVTAPPTDPQAIAEASVQSSQAIITTVIAPPFVDWADDMLNLPDFWRTTPPDLTYQHPLILSLAEQMKQNAWVLLPLALLAIGISVALGRYSGHGGRVVFAVVMAFSVPIRWQWMIDGNNLISGAIGAPDLPSIIRPRLTMTLDPAEQIGSVILTVVYAIVALMLMFSLISRIVMIDVLMVVDAIASMCWATPQSEQYAQRHMTLSVGLVFSQVLIVVGLAIVGAFGSVATGIGGTLMAIATLLALRRMPGLLSNMGQQQTPGYSVVRGAVTRQVVRRVAGR